MSATSHEWDGAGAAGAETAGERLQGWSVAAVGVALAALPLVGTTGADPLFTKLREADDGSREVRAVGHPGTPRTWRPF